MHHFFQLLLILVTRFLDVRFSQGCWSEMRFSRCFARLHQGSRYCQLHCVLQGNLESQNKDHHQHRFICCLDVLAVCMELLEVPVKVIPVHLESVVFLGQSVFDIGRHKTILEYFAKRCPVWRHFFEMSVCRDTHCMSGEASCHGVRDFFGLLDLIDLM